MWGGVAKQEVVEVEDGTAFALKTEPAVLAIAPSAFAIYEIEYGGAIFLVEFTHLGFTSFHNFVIPRGIGLVICRCIAYESVVKLSVVLLFVQMLSIARFEVVEMSAVTVDIAKVVYFKLF